MKKESKRERNSNKLMVLLIVILIVSLVVDLLSLNILYELEDTSTLKGSLANSDAYYRDLVYEVMKGVEGYDNSIVSESMQEYMDEAFDPDKSQYPDFIESLYIVECESNVKMEKEFAWRDFYEENEDRITSYEVWRMTTEFDTEYSIKFWMCSGNMLEICMEDCKLQPKLDQIDCYEDCQGYTNRAQRIECTYACTNDYYKAEEECWDECSYYT